MSGSSFNSKFSIKSLVHDPIDREAGVEDIEKPKEDPKYTDLVMNARDDRIEGKD
jgi:hypothetical protein